jgi:hypothetical protein
MSAAYITFQSEVNEIDQWASVAKKVANQLEKKLRAAQRDRDKAEENDRDKAEENDGYDSSAIFAAYDLARVNYESWGRAVRRQRAIAYCTVFETFLRDFLVEKIVENPRCICAALKKKWGLSLHLSTSPVDHEEIRTFFIKDRDFRFQNVKNAGETYKSIIEWNPFSSEERLKPVATDLRIIWTIRHNLVHCNGYIDSNYRKEFANEDFQERLRLRWDIQTQPPPAADQVLESKAIGGHFTTKLDELGDSIRLFGEHISDGFEYMTEPASLPAGPILQ